MERLIDLDTQFFYWINSHYCAATDWIFWVASQHWAWAIVLVLAFIFTTLRKEPRNWWIVLLGIALCFLLSDRISVLCFKETFCRLRPCHALENVRMFRTTCGGQYGFISSHAANVFSLAIFLALRYRKALRFKNEEAKEATTSRHSAACFTILIFLWALIVGYSRPYLGKHYPGDVICGALVGLIIGIGIYFLSKLIENIRIRKNN